MATFVLYREDAVGDLVGVEYFHSQWCMVSYLEQEGIFTVNGQGGQKVPNTGQYISFGSMPCAVDNVEYPMYCAWCHHPMNAEAMQGQT